MFDYVPMIDDRWSPIFSFTQDDIQDWLRDCPQCQLAANADHGKHHAPMRPLDVPAVFSRWHLDFIGELPTTLKGNKWILVAVDYTSNWTITRAVPVATSQAISDFVFKEIVMKFVCPEEVLTDRGPNFMSHPQFLSWSCKDSSQVYICFPSSYQRQS